MEEIRHAQQILSKNLKLYTLEIFRSRWGDNIKADLEEIGCEYFNLVMILVYGVLPLVSLCTIMTWCQSRETNINII
jgi:hypothetical protein